MLHVLQGGITATCKLPGGEPRMRLEGSLADFVSTLVNDSGRGDAEARCLVPHIPASAHARSNTRSPAGSNQVLSQALHRVADLRRYLYTSSIIIQLLITILTCQSCSKENQIVRSSRTWTNGKGSTSPAPLDLVRTPLW